MDFRLDEAQTALQDTVRRFCAARSPDDPVPWPALADLGVFDVLALGTVEAAVVFEQLGAHLVTGPLLWSALAASDGRVVGGTEDDDPLVEHAGSLDALLVLRVGGVFLVEAGDLPPPEPLAPLDPLTPIGRYPSLPAGTRVGDATDAARLRLHGTVLSAALLLGLADRALDVARDYALEREQFGVPIGSFQAIKHLLADMYVRTALARSATYAAAAVLDGRSAAGAKLLAGEAAVENARSAIQVLGGMGFTWEMLPHYLLKRALVLEHGFGTGDEHAEALADALAAAP
jgi:alkylation response protein AidB-like acyl-CoA dehydrogenase